MATIDWPSALPAPTYGSFKEDLLESKVNDQGEVGAARRRNRFTRALERFGLSMVLSDADKVIIDTFYMTTLVRGVEAFNWTHPVSSTSYEVILLNKPKTTYIAPDRWLVEIAIEEI